MAPSIVDKYEQILAADPRSRIFVELAKALVDRGEHARAVEICERGLEHHPGSILGRVTWGRALLEAGDAKGAMDQFEIAIALEPQSPYAYNHVGETLLRKGMHREAVPVLMRAVELQPADARVRGWLDEARKRAKGEPWSPAPPPAGKIALEDEEKTEPFRPINAPAAPAAPSARRAPAPASGAGRNGAGDGAAAPDGDESSPAAPPVLSRAAAPPPLPPSPPQPPIPPPGAEKPRSVLYMIPGETREVIGPSAARKPAAPAPATPAAQADAAEAERLAAQYEREVRERLLSAPAPPPSFVQRHRRLVGAAAALAVIGAAAGVWLWVDRRNAEELAAVAATRGRAGLARDTLGSLREAHRLLSEARRRASADPEVASLAAQIAAVLATEHGDEDARNVAEALAEDPGAGDGALVAKWLLAGKRAQRMSLEPEIVGARPSSAPMLQLLAGRILASRGEVESGRGRMEIAARANPPLLRALSDLGDLALDAGDAEGALALHASALAAHATHPRAAVGAAEARLRLGRDLETSRKELAAVEADEASAPPRDLRPRFEIAHARVLSALGEAGPAAARLSRAAETLGDSAPLAAALAEIQLDARVWDRAEMAAARAVKLEPREASHRVLLARARIGRGRFAEALAATDGQDGRAIRVQRAIARFRMGQWAQARAELERTAKDGKMPAEAAVWYALVDVATGKAERALPLLEKLAASQSPPPLAHVALGLALEADGQEGDAEEAYRQAVAREPGAPEGHLSLGRLLLSRGRTAEAVAALEKGAMLDPSDLAARRFLGEARIAAGQPAAARADLDFVLLVTPRDATALRLLSAAWLAEKQPEEARRAADRAVLFASRDPASHLAVARAAVVQKDGAAARGHAEKALRLGAKGDAADEARRLRDAAARVRR